MKLAVATAISLIVLVCGCRQEPRQASRTDPVPVGPAQSADVSLVLESSSQTEGYRVINMRLSNPTSSAITFTGYSEESPWYRIQKMANDEWVEHQVGWFCGTGLRECTIEPGKSSLIPVSVPDAIFPVRVGVEYSRGKDGGSVVWSDKIERNSSETAGD